ncbi:MAG: SCO family protein [Actinobacteria bacterium]|nr:SCO family protein [Actinomycetota bacterium]
MALSPLPGSPAPSFTLTDQAGHTMSLSSLRGKAVVLEFMDPHCTDICPIVSQEFVDAYHALGPAAGKVVFAAVNVNQYHASVADMAAYTRAHQLGTIPDWHFFTGPTPRLKAVWSGYHIEVQTPKPNADIVHTSAIYFIDPQGRERYVASPMVDHTKSGKAYLPVRQIGQWAHGIAVLARGLAG